MNLDDCVTCGKPKDAHYGPLKTCSVYPTYRSARDVIASADTHAERHDPVEGHGPKENSDGC